ncbi:zf-DHHC-domain-containing protein [Nemania sp. FL0916]|nr:zf-DHHC-domain-containing protein [Nemania sp. FL0916]
MALLAGPSSPGFQRVAVPFASLLIAILGYGSQWLFATAPDLEPGPLTTTESRVFNALLICVWWTYWRACTVDPGRYEFPRSSGKGKGKTVGTQSGQQGDSTKAHGLSSDDEDGGEGDDTAHTASRQRRWCRKCAAPKPPRAHHCKSCGRCIPKMDHHCPWTGNCVSLQTFPDFVRFLLYTNAALWTLGYVLWQRLYGLWASRHLPAYLGPTLGQLATLAMLSLANGLTSLALGILLITTARGWLFNTTMIEGWEIERHEAVLQRRRGGYGGDDEVDDWWRTSDGDAAAAPRSMVDPVEFPYDVGVWNNLAQAMGSGNPFLWLLPFAGGPRVARLPSSTITTLEDLVARLGAGGRGLGVGWSYEENGLNDREGMWPPIDPDKVRNARLWRQRRREEAQYRREQLRDPALQDMGGLSPEEEKAAFQRRQARDLQRWQMRGGSTRAQIMEELEEVPPSILPPDEADLDGSFVNLVDSASAPSRHRRPRRDNILMDSALSGTGSSGWVNADGEHLRDYGVDEDAEFDDLYDNYDFDYGDDDSDGVGRGTYGRDPSPVSWPGDEDIPLAELIRRRKVRTKDGEDT